MKGEGEEEKKKEEKRLWIIIIIFHNFSFFVNFDFRIFI